jgi:N-acetyltransferase B complex (NatB) non catalytic subunit
VINISEQVKQLVSKLEAKFSERNFAHGILFIVYMYPDDVNMHGLEPTEQCIRYFKRYYQKNACFQDLQVAQSLIPKEKRLEFLSEIEKISLDIQVYP